MGSPFRHALLAGLLVGLLWPSAFAGAEVYQWTDGSGRVHFTQDLSKVPPQHRAAAKDRSAAPPNPRVQRFEGSAPAAQASPRRSPSPSGDPGEIYRIRIQRAGTSMMAGVRLNNSVTAAFVLDTGASDVVVPRSVAEQLGLDLGEGVRTKRYSTANGIVEQATVMLRSVELGGAKVENVPASISDSMEVGLLGLSFFNHFNVNVDAAAGVVTLQRNEMAATGLIRGGRSEAQWRAEFGQLDARIARVEREFERKDDAKARTRQRLEAELVELERQRDLLEAEAGQARVPMSWRH